MLRRVPRRIDVWVDGARITPLPPEKRNFGVVFQGYALLPPLALDRAGEGGDVVLDEEGVDERDGNGPEERAGHERAPVENVAPHQLGEDADRDRLLLGR